MAVIPIEIPECQEISEFPDPMEVTLPGGVTVGQVISAIKSVPNSADMGINLMQQLQPAMAPLVPIFDIIDTVVAVFNCIKAIPDALGPPPDPTAVAACVPDLAKKVDKLLKLIPQLSIPLMGKGLIDVIISTLHGIRSQILALQQQMTSVLKMQWTKQQSLMMQGFLLLLHALNRMLNNSLVTSDNRWHLWVSSSASSIYSWA